MQLQLSVVILSEAKDLFDMTQGIRFFVAFSSSE